MINMNCPEVNGAHAALEEMVEEGTIDEAEAERQFDEWAEQHIADGCPMCKPKE